MTIEIDLTPEEARRAMGLPDLSPLHERYLERLREMMDGGTIAPEVIGSVMKSWAPASDAGVDFWRTFFSPGSKTTGG